MPFYNHHYKQLQLAANDSLLVPTHVVAFIYILPLLLNDYTH